ncbi:MAG: CAP domain-containing protein [Ruminococcus sp.]|nr:CAP domain-containing protein [Ruminococcus sp.]
MKLRSLLNRLCGMFLSFFIAVTSVCVEFCRRPAYAEEIVPDYFNIVEEMVILVNEARTEAGLKPVYAVPVLNNASLVRTLECVDYFSHTRPDGTGFYTVLEEYQISCMGAAENIAAGNTTVEATFEQWKNSSGHWANIMNENYTHMGVGVCYQEGTVYGWYWEQLFIATDEELEDQYIPEREEVVPGCCGDLDGDGYVTSFDFILLIKLLQDKVILNDLQVEAADCMYDGAVTIADAVVLRKYLLHIYDSLPRYP